jgi:hypothetical protein
MEGVPSPVAGSCVVFVSPEIAPLRLVPHVDVDGFPDLALPFQRLNHHLRAPTAGDTGMPTPRAIASTFFGAFPAVGRRADCSTCTFSFDTGKVGLDL